MGRDREYASDAERQAAYRQRKADEEARLRAELVRARGAASARQRRMVSAKLVKVLGMLGSDHAGERDTAARQATQLLKEAGLTWRDVLDFDEK